ncbi:MAG: hypothetical protein ABIP97_13760 [Chthoniobacterales bacterium]
MMLDFSSLRRFSHVLGGSLLLLLFFVMSAMAQTTVMEIKLNRVIIPKVDFKEASLDSVLDYMAQIPVKTKQMDSPVNMVRLYKSTDPSAGEKLITLSLSNVPWTELMRYVSVAANVECEYKPYAIMISAPKPAAKSSPTP